MTKKKLGKSEMGLIKEYCSRLTDEDLQGIVTLLPQTIAFDRSTACSILQKDKEIDRWLSQASGADDYFNRIDGIGEFAVVEADTRSKKSK